MSQGRRHKVVTILLYLIWLHRTCWNNLATNLISTRLLQVVNSLFQTCWQLGTSSANTTCWRLVGRLATRCEIFVCSVGYTRKKAQVVTDLQTSCNKVVIKPISGCVRTACSQLLWQVWNKLLSSCNGNRLATSCSDRTITNTGCS
jgi:hypothetical protein